MSADERQTLEKLPEWVPMYLDCWGSRKPGGGRMTVTFAAEYAGTTPEAVRHLRSRSAAFRRMEWIARNGTAEFAQSYVEAGLRNRLPKMMAAMDKLLESAHPDTVLKLLGWVRGKPQELKITGNLGVDADLGVVLAELTDEELEKLLENLGAAQDAGGNAA